MSVTINGSTGVSGVDGSASTPAYQGGDSNTGVFFPAADTIAFAEGGAEVARFDSSGRLLVGVTSATANGGVLELSGGITFPATAVAASNANTLDDYEEGTWTPTVLSFSGSLTSYTSSANYTKIGRLVSLNIRVTITDAGTAGTYLYINNLPFSVDRTVGSISAYGRETSSTGSGLSAEVFAATSTLWQRYDGAFIGATNNIFSITIVHCV
jgi:hypothetical protein